MTNPISGMGTIVGTGEGYGVSGLGGVDGEAFMQLLLAQLRNQNPLEPMSDSDMMSQFTQLNSLNELQSINQNIVGLGGGEEEQLLQASTLIDKLVEFLGPEGDRLEGRVTGVSVQDGEVLVWIDELGVPLASVLGVRQGNNDD